MLARRLARNDDSEIVKIQRGTTGSSQQNDMNGGTQDSQRPDQPQRGTIDLFLSVSNKHQHKHKQKAKRHVRRRKSSIAIVSSVDLDNRRTCRFCYVVLSASIINNQSAFPCPVLPFNHCDSGTIKYI